MYKTAGKRHQSIDMTAFRSVQSRKLAINWDLAAARDLHVNCRRRPQLEIRRVQNLRGHALTKIVSIDRISV